MNNVKKLSFLFLGIIFQMSAFSQGMSDDTLHISTVNVSAKSKIRNFALLKKNIDSMSISNNVHTDISEVLHKNTPVFVKQSVRGSKAGLSLRGAGTSHTKVLWNNIPLNSPMHGSMDLSLLPFFFADNISILSSASSVTQSDGALGGTLQLETTPEWNKGFNLDYTGAAGSFHTFDNFLKINYSTSKISSSTRLFHSSSENDFKFENNDIINGGTSVRENADFTNYGMLQSFIFRPVSNQFLSFNIWVQKGERGVPGLSTNESGFRNNKSRQKDENLNAILSWKVTKPKISFNTWTAANLQRNKFSTQNYISGTGYFKSIKSVSSSFASFSGIKSSTEINSKHKLSACIRYHYYNVKSHEKIRDNKYNAERNEIYLSMDYDHKLYDFWILNLSIKEDIIENDFYNPNFAFVSSWQINDKTAAYAGVSQSLNHPSLNDLYFIPGGNQDLKPEKAISTDIGLDFSNDNILNSKNSINLYYRKINNLILWRPGFQGYWEPDNIKYVDAAGLEVSSLLLKKINEMELNFKISYALNRSVNTSETGFSLTDNKGQLPYIPLHSINIIPGISWKNWIIKYQWNFYSERYTTSSSSPDVLYTIYPYFMNDVHISKNLYFDKFNLTISGGIYNIFDETYRSLLWQPMPGINYRIGLKFKLK